MQLRLNLLPVRLLLASATMTALAAGSPALAQNSGSVSASCNVGGAPAQLHAQYETVGQYETFAKGGFFGGSIGTGGSTTYWSGTIDTIYGQYRLSGENRFVDAIPVGASYSGKRTLQIISTGPKTFLLKDYFSDAKLVYPCRLNG
jgi:hypothetical protein